MRLRSVLLSFSIFFASAVSVAQGMESQNARSPDEYLRLFLTDFEDNSKQAMAAPIPKFDRQGQMTRDRLGPSYSQRLKYRNEIRSSIKSGSRVGRAAFGPRERVEDFFKPGVQVSAAVESLDGMTDLKVNSLPWSGDYWPTYRGGAAARYSSPDYPTGTDWPSYRAVFKEIDKIDYSQAGLTDLISAAEKYDILMKDNGMTLTKYALNEAEQVYRSEGSIPTWFGLCHGWAPAAFKLPRPRKAVTVSVKNFRGKDVDLKFRPDDLKALATMLWANAAIIENYYLGGRCNEERPKRDENGRVISESCFDINPGLWHLVAINQLAKEKSSFVIDASLDAEVWNQPVISAKVRFFNPETMKVFSSMEEAAVSVDEFKSDKFKKYRSPNGTYFIGVSMELTYVTEVSASIREEDGEKNDRDRKVVYVYDLEVDQSGRVIGGEWYQNAHPDFIWKPVEKSRAVSAFESYLMSPWTSSSEVPSDWQRAAPMSSAYGTPFAGVIEELLKRAQ